MNFLLFYWRVLACRKDICKRQLKSIEWQVVRECAGVLQPVADVTRLVQGGDGTFVGLVCHRMRQLLRVLEGEQQYVRRVAETPQSTKLEPVDTELLQDCVQTLLKATVDVMERKGLGVALSREERLAIILDPRFKDQRLFDTNAQRELARSELHESFRAMTAARSGGEPAGSAIVAAAAEEPATKRARTGNWLEEMDEDELDEVRTAAAAAAAAQAAPPSSTEVNRYLAQPVEPVKGFSMQNYWVKRSKPVLDAEGDVVAEAEFPILALCARQCLAADATSCQPERNFSTLGDVLTALRASTASWKVDMLLFLRMNRHLIPEILVLLQAAQARLAQAAATAGQVASVQQAAVAASRSTSLITIP
jgi:hypothetical protein